MGSDTKARQAAEPSEVSGFVRTLLDRIPRIDDAELRARLDKEDRALRAEMLRISGIQLATRGWRAIVSGKMLETEALKAARRWLDVTEGRAEGKLIDAETVVLVLCGGTGCGKSVAAAWAMTEARFMVSGVLLRRGDVLDDARVPELVAVGPNGGRIGGLSAKSSALPGMRSGGWEGKAAYEALKGCPFLVVDDVAAAFAGKGREL